VLPEQSRSQPRPTRAIPRLSEGERPGQLAGSRHCGGGLLAYPTRHELLQFIKVLLIHAARVAVVLRRDAAMLTTSPMQPHVRITRTGPSASCVTLMYVAPAREFELIPDGGLHRLLVVQFQFQRAQRQVNIPDKCH
jgi:hypothetical protein